MSESKPNLNRREFMIVGSTIVAASSPLLSTAKGAVPTISSTRTSREETGGERTRTKVYYISEGCVGCQCCRMFCPEGAVFFGDRKMEIDQDKCTLCGVCYNECPTSVITETEI